MKRGERGGALTNFILFFFLHPGSRATRFARPEPGCPASTSSTLTLRWSLSSRGNLLPHIQLFSSLFAPPSRPVSPLSAGALDCYHRVVPILSRSQYSRILFPSFYMFPNLDGGFLDPDFSRLVHPAFPNCACPAVSRDHGAPTSQPESARPRGVAVTRHQPQPSAPWAAPANRRPAASTLPRHCFPLCRDCCCRCRQCGPIRPAARPTISERTRAPRHVLLGSTTAGIICHASSSTVLLPAPSQGNRNLKPFLRLWCVILEFDVFEKDQQRVGLMTGETRAFTVLQLPRGKGTRTLCNGQHLLGAA